MVPLIIKRDNRLELYDPNKIMRVSQAAGLTPEQSTALVAILSSWLQSLNLEQLHISKLRDKIVQEMKIINKNASNMFSWYEKTKEK